MSTLLQPYQKTNNIIENIIVNNESGTLDTEEELWPVKKKYFIPYLQKINSKRTILSKHIFTTLVDNNSERDNTTTDLDMGDSLIQSILSLCSKNIKEISSFLSEQDILFIEALNETIEVIGQYFDYNKLILERKDSIDNNFILRLSITIEDNFYNIVNEFEKFEQDCLIPKFEIFDDKVVFDIECTRI